MDRDPMSLGHDWFPRGFHAFGIKLCRSTVKPELLRLQFLTSVDESGQPGVLVDEPANQACPYNHSPGHDADHKDIVGPGCDARSQPRASVRALPKGPNLRRQIRGS